jgi:hypothetical protein
MPSESVRVMVCRCVGFQKLDGCLGGTAFREKDFVESFEFRGKCFRDEEVRPATVSCPSSWQWLRVSFSLYLPLSLNYRWVGPVWGCRRVMCRVRM